MIMWYFIFNKMGMAIQRSIGDNNFWMRFLDSIPGIVAAIFEVISRSFSGR